ncbi:hypothetical protein IWX90DRAFT_482489 [Phyllosticta citrichinensis]|uniref:Uncharacterized protein n=1 Tax=Phyllosticta citrichinensis TaxID=1130410 RepID=A0ABR1Y703_9PEZI
MSTTSTTAAPSTSTTTHIKGASALDFPALSSATEAARLRAQHALVTAAVGGLAPPTATSCTNCARSRRTQRRHLATPRRRPTCTSRHDILTPFPAAWRNSFDLIQLRTVLSNLARRAQAVATLANVLPLLKPGTGHVQLVDGTQMTGTIRADDRASVKVLRALANGAESVGRDLGVGRELVGLLRDACTSSSNNSKEDENIAIDITDAREVHSIFGHGAGSAELEELGVSEMRSLYRVVRMGMQQMGSGVWEAAGIPRGEFEGLEEALVRETRECGVPWTWYVADARRVR